MNDGLSGRQVDVVLPPPVGRVCKSWGTDDRRKRAERKQLLFDLSDYGQTEVLLAFKRGDRSWQELLNAKRTRQLASASLSAGLLLDRPLKASIESTLPKMGASKQTRTRYEGALQWLDKTAARRVGDLVILDWPDLWAQMGDLSPASRNRVRSAVSAFLSVFLGEKFHPYRREVIKAMGQAEDENTGAPRTITIDEFLTLLKHVEDAAIPSVLTLAGTGMRVAEYMQCGEKELRHFPTIYIPGEGSVQVARWLKPYVEQAIPCRLGPAPKYDAGKYPGVQFDRRYKVLYRVVRNASEATGIPCTPHYLRHLFAALAVQSTDPIRAQHALRHKTPGMTAHYAKEKSGQVVADAVGNRLKKVRDFVRDGVQKKRKRTPANNARSRGKASNPKPR